ncbi:MAG: WbqC family protein [Candidatus Edwardsbacteria bacterium]
MILAAHQPNYLPWLGYFHKMTNCDIFVFLDDVQFARRSFTHRTRIKFIDGRAGWLTVPVKKKGRYFQKINEVKINNEEDWQTRHLKTLEHCYKKAPYFHDYDDLLELIYKDSWENLSKMNLEIVKKIAHYLKISPQFLLASEMNVEGKGTDLIISLCQKCQANVYLSGRGGERYLEKEKFDAAGIQLLFSKFSSPRYPQLWGNFVPNFSIVDLLFNVGEKSAEILRDKLGVFSKDASR